MNWGRLIFRFIILLLATAFWAGCQDKHLKLTLREEAANAMIGLQALQYEDYRFWYHKIEKRAVVNRDKEAEATLLFLQASEKLIYWKEPKQEIDSLLNLALSKSTDDSLITAIQLRKADYLIGIHQFEEAHRLLTNASFILDNELASEKAFLVLRANSYNFNIEALNILIDSLKAAEVSQDLLMKFISKAGDIAYNQGHFNWAANYYTQALLICQKIGWQGFQARLYVDLADVSLIFDQLDSVNYFVEKANVILDKIPGPITACNGYSLAGRAQLKLGEIALASNTFQTLLTIANETNSPNNKIKAYLGLAEAALYAKKWHQADSLVLSAIEFTQQSNDDVLIHQAFFLASKINNALGYLPKAIMYLEKCELIERQTNDTTELIVTLDEKLRLLLKVGNYQAFKKVLDEQEVLLSHFSSNEAQESFFQLKADWYARQGKFKEANAIADLNERFLNKLNGSDDNKIEKINQLQRKVLLREVEVEKEKGALLSRKYKLFLLIGFTIVFFLLLFLISIIRLRKLKIKTLLIIKDKDRIVNERINLEKEYLQLKDLKDNYLSYKNIELNLFESWSNLSERKGISITRYNIIIFYYLKDLLSFVVKSINAEKAIDNLPSDISEFNPYEMKSEWEASWDSLRFFHPCSIEIYFSDQINWKSDKQKIKVLIDILVRQFIFRSSERMELYLKLYNSGFTLETSLLHEYVLSEIINIEGIYDQYICSSSNELQYKTSKYVIKELITDLKIRIKSRKDADIFCIDFNFLA